MKILRVFLKQSVPLGATPNPPFGEDKCSTFKEKWPSVVADE
jgi:hypothetical protein